MAQRAVLGGLGLAVVAIAIGPRTPLAGQPPILPIAANAVGGAFGGDAEDNADRHPRRVHVAPPPMTAAATRTWLKMQDQVPMPFASDTAIGEVIAHIRKATAEPAGFPKGIPIYLDPRALADADKTPSSPVTIDLEGIPLATTLKLALAQLDLAYRITDDGLVCVISKDESEESDGLVRILEELEALRDEIRSLRTSAGQTPSDEETTPGRTPMMRSGMGSVGGMR